jgi:hypothetical protein
MKAQRMQDLVHDDALLLSTAARVVEVDGLTTAPKANW